ncbi:MAG: hypothetical protein IH881_19130 [Myxococcales bacterium]|nr:hypothetical protein [Myxococcales bacterium]
MSTTEAYQITGSNADKNASQRLHRRAAARKDTSTSWRPNPGQELLGTFIEWSSGKTSRDETYQIAVIETEDGQRLAVWLFYAVLRDEFDKADPQPGELLLIQRSEDRTGANGSYRMYSVTVDRDSQDSTGGAS